MTSRSSFIRGCAAGALAVGIIFATALPARGQCQNQSPIDGRNIPAENACAPHELQDNYTGFTDTQPGRTNGSELDALYVKSDYDTNTQLGKLYVGITGNVATDFENAILVFIQARPLCNRLFSDTLPLETAAALRAIHGVQFDGTPGGPTDCNQDGFAPSHCVQIWNDGSGLHCRLTDLEFGTTSPDFLSSTTAANHNLTGINVFSANMSNIAGVDANTSGTPAQEQTLARTATSGVQLAIDLNDPNNPYNLGIMNPAGVQIKVMAWVVSGGGCASNQMLPPLPSPATALPPNVCSAGCLGNQDLTPGMENRISLSDQMLPTGEAPRWLGNQFVNVTLANNNAGRPVDYTATRIPQAYGDVSVMNPLALQSNFTCFGDAQPIPGVTVGSELDQMFIKNTPNRLRISITGNLENNGNATVLLLDVNSNGTNAINGQASGLANRDFAVTGGSDFGQPTQPGLNGLTLDAGFAPDYAVTVQRDAAAGTPDDAYNVFIRNLNANTFRYLGRAIRNSGDGILTPPAPNQNGSELDQLFVRADATNLYIGITGNLEPGTFGNSWIIFLETGPGGMNVMATSALPDNDRWNALRNINGDAMDTNFSPTYALVYRRTGNGTPALSSTVSLVNLTTGGGLATTDLALVLNGVIAPNTYAADNLNAAGVTSDNTRPAAQQMIDAASADRGLQIAVARSAIGSPSNGTSMKIAAYLISRSGYWSNQLLPGVGVDTGIDGNRGNLADPPNPTLPNAGGDQFAMFTLTSTTAPGGYDGTQIPTRMGGTPIATQNNHTGFGDAVVPSGSGNPNCTQVALDNSNTAGVTDISAAGAATATTGFEFDIAYQDIGLTPGQLTQIQVLAILTGRYGLISNQLLPALHRNPNTGNLNNTPADLSDNAVAPGNQFVSYVLQGAHNPADINGDNVKTPADLTAFIGVLLGTNTNQPDVCNADLNGQDGPDGDDIQPFINAYF